MTIHIESIQAQNLGPLDSFQAKLGKVSLFYGLNESGKTYLVEFLLHSLFRQSKSWELRPSLGKGNVHIRGLGSEPIAFRPDSNKKIDNYWDEDGRGLPLNMARLLVVKGGELALSTGSPGGVDRNTLRSALTSQELLDQIWESIPATARNAALEDSQILGKNMGLIKTRTELLEEIRELEILLEKIEDNYSLGPAFEIENKIEAASEKLESQYKAKRHLAYRTRQSLDALERQREEFNKNSIQDLRDAIRDLDYLERDFRKLQSKLEEEEQLSKEYTWLENALEIWEGKSLEKKKSPPKYLGIAGLSGLIIGAVALVIENFLSFPDLIWIGATLSVIGLALSLYFGIRLLKLRDQIDDSLERKSIQEQYQLKFDTPLHGLTDLKTRKSTLQEIYVSAQTTQKLLDEKINQLNLHKQSISNSFMTFNNMATAEEDWQDSLTDIIQKSEEIDNSILEVKLQLSQLNILQDDFWEGPVETEYDPEIIQELDGEIQQYKANLAILQDELNTLKARACERTGDDLKTAWKMVLYNIQSLLAIKTLEYKKLTAELVAQIGLVEVLTRLKEEEDQKIIEAINTKSVSDLLYRITGRYQKLDLIDDQLIVYDAFSSYPLRDLSTGAREQVLLALRLGIASHVTGDNPLFLILDDAFQHSDWQRREALILSTLELAQSGWQILYLSMDDHIRDLFLKEIKPILKKDFKLLHLA